MGEEIRLGKKDVLTVKFTDHGWWVEVHRNRLMNHWVSAEDPDQAIRDSQRALEESDHECASRHLLFMFQQGQAGLWRWEEFLKLSVAPWDWLQGLKLRVDESWGTEGSLVARKATLGWLEERKPGK